MKISLSPIKQVAIGYYHQGIEDYINLGSTTRDKLEREITNSINSYSGIPTDSKTRIIARVVRIQSQDAMTELVSGLTNLLYDVSSSNGTDVLISLIDEASNAMKLADPKEFRAKSDASEFNDRAINTFEFLQLVADGGIHDFLTLKYAIPEAIIERLNNWTKDMGKWHHRGLNTRQRTPFQMELIKNPDLFRAAIKGFLELDDADQLIDFAHTIFALKFSVIKRQWEEKDAKAKEIVINAIRRATQIAEKKLNGQEEVFDEQIEPPSIEEFMKYPMIHMEHFPFHEIPLSRKIEFANKFKENLFLIANSLPDMDSTREQINASLNEMTSDFELPKTIGVYSWTKEIFEMFDDHAFILKSRAGTLRSN